MISLSASCILHAFTDFLHLKHPQCFSRPSLLSNPCAAGQKANESTCIQNLNMTLVKRSELRVHSHAVFICKFASPCFVFGCLFQICFTMFRVWLFVSNLLHHVLCLFVCFLPACVWLPTIVFLTLHKKW